MVHFYTYLEMFLDDLHKQISLIEFEKHFKKPHQTIKRHLKFLTKSKILIEDKKNKFLFYKLNLENPLLFEYLSICEKERTFKHIENPLFNRLYELISPEFKNSNILIFGSSATKKTFNDIDILILNKTASENNNLKKELNLFEQTYSIKLHIIWTNRKTLTKTFKKEILKNHIILNNHDYFVKILYKNE